MLPERAQSSIELHQGFASFCIIRCGDVVVIAARISCDRTFRQSLVFPWNSGLDEVIRIYRHIDGATSDQFSSALEHLNLTVKTEENILLFESGREQRVKHP
jgi:hypothetical protein